VTWSSLIPRTDARARRTLPRRVQRHLLAVVEVDLLPGGVADLDHGVGHRGLHPYAEHVQLDQAQPPGGRPLHFDVVLVSLSHGVVAPGGGLHRHPVQAKRLFVDLQPARGLHIDVDVRQGRPPHRQLEHLYD
jgi:hypothetical protein